jgi:hypothetical protein
MNIVYLEYIAVDRINYYNYITKTNNTMGRLHEDLGRLTLDSFQVECSWNLMAHGEAGKGSEGETGEWSG